MPEKLWEIVIQFIQFQQFHNRMAEDLEIVRIIDAPREEVWKAWTEPQRLMGWHGPKGYTCPLARLDVREGGESFTAMQSSEGDMIYSKGTYTEVIRPARLVITDSFADKDGNIVSPTYYKMGSEFPEQMLLALEFEDLDGRTRMTLRHMGLAKISADDRNGMEQGWNESLDKLEESLKTRFTAMEDELRVVTERTFDAPKEKVFQAITDPAMVPQWWGPRIMETDVEKMDVKPGGKWRIVQKDPEGKEYAFRGVYKDIIPGKKVSYTMEWEEMPGHVLVETITFEERGGKTRLIDEAKYESAEDMRGMLETGMESGALESMERLAALVEG